MWYHVVLNRGNRWEVVFHKLGDYDAFIKANFGASASLPMDHRGYCPMPSHFHLALKPHHDGDLVGGRNGYSQRTSGVTIGITHHAMSGRDLSRLTVLR